MLEAVQIVSMAVPARTPKEILKCLRFEACANGMVVLMATDLEIGVRTEVDGECQSPGVVLVQASEFGQILRESTEDTLTIESAPPKIVISGSHSKFRVGHQEPSLFPVVSDGDAGDPLEIDSALFRSQIQRTAVCACEDARFALNGVYLDTSNGVVTAVGTDGRRLASMTGCAIDQPWQHQVIIPARAANLLQRVAGGHTGSVLLRSNSNGIFVRVGDTLITARLVEGRFPKWRDMMPVPGPDWHSVRLFAGPIIAAVRQASIFTSRESKGVDLTFSTGNLAVSASLESGDSRIDIPIAYEGGETVISLDRNYLIDSLNAAGPDQEIAFSFLNEDAGFLVSLDDGYKCVIMPLVRD